MSSTSNPVLVLLCRKGERKINAESSNAPDATHLCKKIKYKTSLLRAHHDNCAGLAVMNESSGPASAEHLSEEKLPDDRPVTVVNDRSVPSLCDVSVAVEEDASDASREALRLVRVLPRLAVPAWLPRDERIACA